MRVLVTRPEPAASRTAAELKRRGHEPLLLPLTVAEHDSVALSKALSRPHSAIAVTSAEAMRALAALRDTPASLFDMPCFTVGEATAHAAWKAGFHNTVAGDNDGTALARLIAERIGKTISPERPVLYLAGSPRAAGFEAELAARTIPFEVCECYRMRPFKPSLSQMEQALGTGPVDAVLLYSSESARHVFECTVLDADPSRFASTRFLCLSEKIVDVVPEPFRSQAEAAAVPTEASLLSLL